ncbi:MAG: hypothetical protein QOD41_632 [Cryptosporangiaceae bacterium]|jgi:hypothetical protein|nr:hypothetical protein [Cryptosporangiaceae bacterium]
MSHVHGTHSHGDHEHSHPHGHGEPAVQPPAWADPSIPDTELSPRALSRRSLLRNAGLLGAGTAAVTTFGASQAAAAAPLEAQAAEDFRRKQDQQPLLFLAGDHHMHTQFSSDGLYRVRDHAEHAAQYGLDWMVITDHGGASHAKFAVDAVNPHIQDARTANPRLLVFQGVEWNIPAAEHGTVFVAPGPNEVAVLKQFEATYDGTIANATDGTPGGPNTAKNEALAIAGLKFLAEKKTAGEVADALMFANHPARKGLDSPHEIRAWRDAAPGIAMGFEGAPGHQAAGIPGPGHEASGRGYYDNNPTAQSFPGYPLATYITWGGFDWMTATVGGLWDSLLAEGRPWWITANSDSHWAYRETLVHAPFAPGENFDTHGQYPDPVEGGKPDPATGDFLPGYYSRTHVGATRFGYTDVMAGLRAGRVWVDHGGLVDGLDVRLSESGKDELGATLGGMIRVKKGTPVRLTITIDPASRPNFHGDLPKLARVDLIKGLVTGAPADADTFTTPYTKVVKSFDVSNRTGRIRLTLELKDTVRPFYLRLRGTDGKRSQPGLLGAAIDPHGPAADVRGNADPWQDLWFYSNPIFVDVSR